MNAVSRQQVKDVATALLPFFLVSWPHYLNDFYLIPLSGSGRLDILWSLDVVFYFLVPSATLYFLYRRRKLDHVRDALKMPARPGRVVAAALLLALATHYVFTLHINEWFMQHGCCRLCAGYAFPKAQPWRMLMIVYAAATAGILEEIIYRAHLMTLLKRVIRDDRIVVALSCVLFGLIHWCGGSGKIAYTAVMGAIPAIIYLRTGNLWLPVLWHTMNDVLALMNNP